MLQPWLVQQSCGCPDCMMDRAVAIEESLLVGPLLLLCDVTVVGALYAGECK